MTTQTQNLNLARKWRPQSFDTIVGQPITLRMLKNSLFLNKLFPVYLFAGQRGCGKTTTARVFAAAVNCHHVDTFQKDPNISLPCLTCSSCIAMSKGDHPDFIEIDAASHTGVDNVRQIIDASSYMPLVGRKKIYLIDEAHMLSKAAFNAFLKVLEEPPASVMFILATTESNKFPTTVLSRCFQLTFNPIDNETLKNHLTTICTNEGVIIDPAALDVLLDETEGSVRDAINLLERVRFSSDHITEQTIHDVLGKISTQQLFTIFQRILEQNAPKLLDLLQTINFEQRSPQLLWDMLVHLCRALVWIKYGVQTIPGGFQAHRDQLTIIAQGCSLNRINAIFTLLWSQEELFLKTSRKHLFLEMILVQLCQQVDIADVHELIKSCKDITQTPSRATIPEPQHLPSTPVVPVATATLPPHEAPTPSPQPSAPEQPIQPPSDWDCFVNAITQIPDPVLCSIFKQATLIKKEDESKQVIIQLNTESTFFKNKITETKNLWFPSFCQFFQGYTGFAYAPSPRVLITPQPKLQAQTTTSATPTQQPHQPQRSAQRAENDYLIIKNSVQWPKASLLLRYFPGKIKRGVS